MKYFTRIAIVPACCLGLWAAGADTKPANTANPLTKSTEGIFKMAQGNVMKSAEEMPESNYSFKPTDSVRSYGQVLAHIADGQYEFCSAASGDTSKHPSVEESAKTKADITAALTTAFGYCAKVYDGMTDEHAADMVSFFGRQMPKLSVMSFNTAHTMEHYGNLVTYLRMKGLVPPSSKQ